jgi:hypothetical protein
MFNLFKKKQSNDNVSLQTKETSYPAIVDEIHNEFYTAGENILNEATSLLKELEQKDLAKGERLASLGFSKTREAVVAIESKNKIANTKEIADLVVYYQHNYPNNKFITEKQVEQICKKYSLVFGEISMYKGFVPENKLKLIEDFKVNSNDIGVVKAFYSSDPYVSCFFDLKNVSKWRINDFNNGEPIIHDNWYYKKDIKLKIVAPLKDMEIPKGQELVGYKIQNIPDPVVLQPVNGGYLIVCAWGDEASDEIVVNQTMN